MASVATTAVCSEEHIKALQEKAGKAQKQLLVFWPHSVFGQNHLCVKML
jgi:hypothetical protein